MEIRIPASGQAAHPVLFGVLFFPFGASGGFLALMIVYFLSHKAGVTAAEFAPLLSLSILPNVIKVFWAPLIDVLFTPKVWYVLGVLITGAGVVAGGIMPIDRSTLPYLGGLMFLVSAASTFTSISAEALMAHGVESDQRGRAGGWSQVGNLGGSALGGGAGLWLAVNASREIAGLALGAVIVCCAAGLLAAPPAKLDYRHPSYLTTIRRVLRDLWSIAWSRNGLLTLFVFLLPLGTGVAANYFAAIAVEWKASAQSIAFVAGAGSVASAAGALAGGYVCDRFDRKAAYVLLSLVSAAVTIGMALAPRTPVTYAVFVLAYGAATSLAFAAYAALTLETIGAGAAGTKFNLMASVANAPLLYVNAIEGPVQTRFGSTAMLLTEAALGIGAAILFTTVVVSTRRPKAASAGA